MNIEEIRDRLTFMNLAEVARLTGVDYFVLWRIANGRTVRPAYDDIHKLFKFFEDK